MYFVGFKYLVWITPECKKKKILFPYTIFCYVIILNSLYYSSTNMYCSSSLFCSSFIFILPRNLYFSYFIFVQNSWGCEPCVKDVFCIVYMGKKFLNLFRSFAFKKKSRFITKTLGIFIYIFIWYGVVPFQNIRRWWVSRGGFFNLTYILVLCAHNCNEEQS